MIFTNLFYLNLLAKTIIIEGELFHTTTHQRLKLSLFKKRDERQSLGGSSTTHATVSNPYPLRVLPLAKLFALVVQSQTSLHCTHLLTTFHLDQEGEFLSKIPFERYHLLYLTEEQKDKRTKPTKAG